MTGTPMWRRASVFMLGLVVVGCSDATDVAPPLDAPETIEAQQGTNNNQYIGVEYEGLFEASIVSDVPGIEISTAVGVGPDRGQGTAVLLMYSVERDAPLGSNTLRIAVTGCSSPQCKTGVTSTVDILVTVVENRA